MRSINQIGIFYKDRNAYVVGGEPTLFHCHHYNCFLQRSLEQTREYIDIHAILRDSAQEIAYSQFKQLFSAEQLTTIDERKAFVEHYFSFCGFGKIDLQDIKRDGGIVKTPYDHYSIGWKQKFGERLISEPGVSFYTCGFLAGAMESVYDLKLGTVAARQTACITHGFDHCSFELYRRNEVFKLLGASPGEGAFHRFAKFCSPPDTGIDYIGVREALTNMPLRGDEKDGLIKAFGVYLTRHHANYYMLITLKAIHAMRQRFGQEGIDIISALLIEAGHVCAFNTFGGIMLSAEWNALIKPMMKDQGNPMEWIHGIVACANALGWGYLQAYQILPEGKSEFRTLNGYETNAALRYSPAMRDPISYLMQGGYVGIMNLTYHGNIMEHPELNEEYYTKIFKTPGKYSATPKKSRMAGDAMDTFEVCR